MIKNWTKPKLSKATCKGRDDWHVYYYFINPDTGNKERKKERFDLNRIKDLKQRLAYGMECVRFLTEQLEAGFNPFTAGRVKDLQGDILEQVQLVKGIKVAGGSDRMAQTYTCMCNRLGAWVKDTYRTDLKLANIGLESARDFQHWLRGRGLMAKTVNATISHVGVLWDVAVEQGIAFDNPWRQVAPVKEKARGGKDIYEPITLDEMKRIVGYLNENGHRHFWRFCAMVYYAWVRPIEVMRLKVGDIDLAQGVINFRGEATKNHAGGRVQIVPPLLALLNEMGLQQYPADYFLFTGRAYLPGPGMRDHNEVWRKWTKLVKEKLGINKNMYALKHTGNIDFLLNNKGKVDPKWQQMQNRHSSLGITERYCRKLGAYFVDTSALSFTEF